MSRPRKNRRRFKHVKDIVVYSPSSEDVSLAHKRSCRLGVPHGSYSHGMGRMTGFLGEIAVNTYLPRSRYAGDKQFGHDIVYKKQRIEVKSKTCSGRPEPEYSAFANGKKNMDPDNDVYFFTRVRRDLQKVYLCGWLPTPTLLDEAEFFPEGSTDDSGYVFKMSGFNIEIGELNPPKALR